MKKIVILLLMVLSLLPISTQARGPLEILSALENSINSIKIEVSSLDQTLTQGLTELETNVMQQSIILKSLKSSTEQIPIDIVKGDEAIIKEFEVQIKKLKFQVYTGWIVTAATILVTIGMTLNN